MLKANITHKCVPHKQSYMHAGLIKYQIWTHRAVYADADIYFLDNVLSAVDVSVRKHLIEKVIFGLLAPKCLIVATNPMDIAVNHEKVYLRNGELVEEEKLEGVLEVMSVDEPSEVPLDTLFGGDADDKNGFITPTEK